MGGERLIGASPVMTVHTEAGWERALHNSLTNDVQSGSEDAAGKFWETALEKWEGAGPGRDTICLPPGRAEGAGRGLTTGFRGRPCDVMPAAWQCWWWLVRRKKCRRRDCWCAKTNYYFTWKLKTKLVLWTVTPLTWSQFAVRFPVHPTTWTTHFQPFFPPCRKGKKRPPSAPVRSNSRYSIWLKDHPEIKKNPPLR